LLGKEVKESKFKSQSTMQQQLQQEKQQQAATKGIITIQQQATLVTVFIMLSTISPPTTTISPPNSTSSLSSESNVRVELLLMAQHWIVRMWQVFFAHAAKHPPPKPGKDETLSDLPKSAHEWASLLLTEEAATRLRTALNPIMVAVHARDGLVKGIGPEAFLSYLMYLEKQLEVHGYYVHCFPVLGLARMIVGELSPKPLVWPLLAQLYLHFHNVCQKLQMEEQARVWMELADGIFPLS
jgi:hypothetical protein